MNPMSKAKSRPPFTVLLVEDSRFFGSIVRDRLTTELGARVTWVQSRAEAQRALSDSGEHFLLAVLDLNLPDAPDGEIVDDVLAQGIAPVVLTASMSDTTRDVIWSKRVVDYVLKEGPHAIDTVVDTARRLASNPGITVLVIDDSVVARAHLRQLLEVHRYRVLEARGGEQGLNLLAANPDIKLVLVDYHMPGMDGFEVVKRMRKTHRREDLAIVGVSAHGSGHLSARFLKSGANDFLYKPFVTEEFYCRVAENIRALEHLRRLEDMATKDFLTGLHNRRYFFDTGRKLCENALRRNLDVAVAMLDIDHFKRVNDTYGHDAGDVVLQQVASTIAGRFRRADVVARLGGEEFAVLTTNMDQGSAHGTFDGVRQGIQDLRVRVGDTVIPVTVSCGVSCGPVGEIEALLNHADELLYEAKHGGRNRVLCAPTPGEDD
jgi:diguanylate cyclase (GGDEF)-like protein